MFKVGDEVLVKGEIISVGEEVPYPVEVMVCACSLPLCFTEEELKLDTKTYEQGLADAWELAKKIYEMSSAFLEKIFGEVTTFLDVINGFTVEEALAKITAYEQENEITVGNEVIDNDGVKACVLEQTTTDHFFVFTETGSVENWSKGNFKNTGKHIDIEGLFRQIGE